MTKSWGTVCVALSRCHRESFDSRFLFTTPCVHGLQLPLGPLCKTHKGTLSTCPDPRGTRPETRCKNSKTQRKQDAAPVEVTQCGMECGAMV